MNESARTLTYIAAAALALGAAWMARPASPDRKIFEDSGQAFFDAFDPLNAKSMEIISYNQSANNWYSFKVAQSGGKWSIPSHENYPADAKDHLAQAAASVLDLKKGPKVSDNPGDHALYGVVDPTAQGAGLGSGTHVVLQDGAGTTLVDLIIGKTVKDSENLHYVRVPGKDRVYTAKVNTDKLSTKFEDWIERDLLKLNPGQVKNVFVNDYSVDVLNGTLNQGDRMRLRYTLSTPTPAKEGTPPPPSWTLDDLKPGETLQTEKLDDMRSALGDLKIIDVHKKPAGLSSQLAESGNFTPTSEVVTALAQRGFYWVQVENTRKLLSNEGEITITTVEGVDYNLRFGEIVNVEGGSDLSAKEGETAATQQNGRFLFVTASFNASAIELPDYAPVPPAASQPAAASGTTQPETAPEDPARLAIIAANDQKRKDYEAKIKAGEDKVKALNARFADWYYVVSDGVYQKLRFKRADIVTAAGATPSAGSMETPPPAPSMPGGQ